MISKIISFFTNTDQKVSRALRVFTDARQLLEEAISEFNEQNLQSIDRIDNLKAKITDERTSISIREDKIVEVQNIKDKIDSFLE